MTRSNNRIARRIAYFIKQRKITQQEFLDLLLEQYGIEISQPTVSNWKNGVSSPSIELAPVFCEIFDISLHELFGIPPEQELLEEEKQLLDRFNAEPRKVFLELMEKYDLLLMELQKVKQEKEEAERRLGTVAEQMKKHLGL